MYLGNGYATEKMSGLAVDPGDPAAICSRLRAGNPPHVRLLRRRRSDCYRILSLPWKKWWQLAGQFAGLYWINVMLLAGMQIPLQLFGHAFEISEQGLALLCLPLLWCYHGRQGAHNRKIQLACYAFYPVHMLVLGILSKLIFSSIP